MQVLKLLLSSTFFLFLFLSNINSETITVKCYIDKEQSYSFLINKEKKEVLWLDQNNQKLQLRPELIDRAWMNLQQ